MPPHTALVNLRPVARRNVSAGQAAADQMQNIISAGSQITDQTLLDSSCRLQRTFNRQLSTGKNATNFFRDLSLVVVSHLIDPPLFFVRSSARCGKLQLYLGELGQPELHLGRALEPNSHQVSAHFQIRILQICPVSLI